MNTDKNRFARIAALRPARRSAFPAADLPAAPAEPDALAELLGAQINRNHFGEHLSVRQWHATPEMYTPDPHSLSIVLPKPAGEDILTSVADPAQWLFLDTETTGLAGGTGTYAFLVGIAWWDAGGLQVEQFFLRDLDEEHSMLLELSLRMKERPVLVTFNGKSFDWPLLETRYRMTRSVRTPAPTTHLDLLHPARQLWKLRLGSVRLRELECFVLGNQGRPLDWTRDDDIDSSFIPQIYFDYLRGGYARPLAGVFRHNQMDLRGLAALAGRIFALLDSRNEIARLHPHGASTRDPLEILGLSRMLRRRGESATARELYEAALLHRLPKPLERLAQRELAQLAKRGLDYGRAISLWEVLRRSPRRPERAGPAGSTEDRQKTLLTAIEAAEQLAIYYEHRAKQPWLALDLVRTAIAELRIERTAGDLSRERSARIEARLLRRLLRLERRCASAGPLPYSGKPD